MKKVFGSRRPKVPESVKRNVGSIAQLEQAFLDQRSTVTCISDRVHDLVASPFFIAAHICWFVGWIVINTIPILEIPSFDPYPFSFLGLCLASEAILLTTFILVSQQRQSWQADQWVHVSLQLALLAEQENTKMLQMLQSMCQRMGMSSVANDTELKEMTQETLIGAIVQEMETARTEDDAVPQTEMQRAA